MDNIKLSKLIKYSPPEKLVGTLKPPTNLKSSKRSDVPILIRGFKDD